MSDAVSPFEALATAAREATRAAAAGVLQIRARGARPATAAHLAPDVVLAALHTLERDEGLVVTRGDTALDATVIGRDESLDIALVRAEGLGTPPARLAATDPEPAQLGVAVSRSWSGNIVARLSSVTGTTCPPRRWRAEPVPFLVRTDVPPGRGIAGGVLAGPDGLVHAWLTTALGRGAVLGVPATLVADRLARLLEHGRIRRGYVGLAVQPVMLAPGQQPHGRQGLLVSGIDALGTGTAAGLFVGDILLEADGQPLADPGAMQSLLVESRIGTSLRLRVLRGGDVTDVTVTVGERRQ